MKKIIALVIVMIMVIVMCGAASQRAAVDYSSVIEELEDQGFTRRGDVWTLDVRGEDDLEWVVAWYDMVDNYGVMTVYGQTDEYSKTVYISGYYAVEWDFDEDDFVITDVLEIRR